MGRAAAALALDDGPRLLGGGQVDVGGQDAGPVAGEEHGRGLAVAPAGPHGAGAGDDGDLVLQALVHLRLLRPSSVYHADDVPVFVGHACRPLEDVVVEIEAWARNRLGRA